MVVVKCPLEQTCWYRKNLLCMCHTSNFGLGMEQDQSNKNHTAHGVEVVLGVLLALVGLIVIILGVLTFYHLR